MPTPPFKIIYEDNHLLCLVKPAGILTQADGSDQPDLLSQGKEYIKKQYNKPGNVFLGIVQRLDRSVGGIIVFAKTSKAAARLSERFRERETQKLYLAVVEGIPKNPQGHWSDYMRKDEDARMAREAQAGQEGAQKAELEYTVQHSERKGNLDISYLEIRLLTGRFHQIRFQTAKRGHPIVGDKKYGSHMKLPGEGIGLYCTALRVKHPVKDEMMEFRQEPPKGWPFGKE